MNKTVRNGVLALAILGCAGFASDADSVWMQQKSVAIGTANFLQCVTAAANSVKGVAVNHSVSGSAHMVPLEVTLAKPISFLDVEVQYRGGNSAAIIFTGRGNTEPDSDRGQITPVLQSLVDAIGKSCGTSKH